MTAFDNFNEMKLKRASAKLRQTSKICRPVEALLSQNVGKTANRAVWREFYFGKHLRQCNKVQQDADVLITARRSESRHRVRDLSRIPLALIQQSPLFSMDIAHREGEGK